MTIVEDNTIFTNDELLIILKNAPFDEAIDWIKQRPWSKYPFTALSDLIMQQKIGWSVQEFIQIGTKLVRTHPDEFLGTILWVFIAGVQE